MDQEVQQRKEEILGFFKKNKSIIPGAVAVLIALFGFFIRTRNWKLIGSSYPIDPDANLVLRYVKYVFENGRLFDLDPLRNYPVGFNGTGEFEVLSHFIVYLYKFLHFFNSNVTIEFTHIAYPAFAFFIAAIFFYLFVKKLFDYRVALLSTFLLSVVPTFLFRTMSGISDKEALATIFMFMTFYFYVSAIKSKNVKNGVLFGILSGISTALMGLVWAGVNLLFLSFGAYAIIMLLFEKFDKTQIYAHVSWIASSILMLLLFFSERYTLIVFVTSPTTAVAIFSAILSVSHYLFFEKNYFDVKDKILNKHPFGILNVAAVALISLFTFVIIYGVSPFIDILNGVYIDLVRPFGRSRWALTVAESHQPYFTDWIGQMGWQFLLLFFLGSVFMFYKIVKNLKHGWKLTAFYAAFIFLFTMSRYSPQSRFNGENGLSIFLYVGSLAIFIAGMIGLYIYSFYKFDKGIIKNIDMEHSIMFVFAYFFFGIIAARGAIRLFYIFAPVTVIIAAYFLLNVKDYIIEKNDKIPIYILSAYVLLVLINQYNSLNNLLIGLFILSLAYLVSLILDYDIGKDWHKSVSYLIILLVIASPSIAFTSNSYKQSQYITPTLNPQWVAAMEWVKKNTQEDAVFAHWWDYGYYIQTAGERATITDGGNVILPWNHFMGRNVLTGKSEEEALTFLKTHNATHLLIVKEEVGKYPAFSSIGADENYDRYSWISNFYLSPENTVEKRNETIYAYTAGTVLDDDFIYKNELFPAFGAGIGAFFIPIKEVEVKEGNATRNEIVFGQPNAALVYGGRQVNVPVNCIFFNNKEIIFGGKDALPGCIRILPTITGQQMNPIGSLMWLSKDVYEGLFAKLYLMNMQSENFRLVHGSEQEVPIALYNGELIGPIKIWEINYPKEIEPDPIYLSLEFPNPNVTIVKRR